MLHLSAATMIAIACIAAIALLWGRVVALRFGWPTWLVAGSLAALGSNVAAMTGGQLWPHPACSLTALGLAVLAAAQLAPRTSETETSPPRRPHVWWATLGTGSALAGVTAPVLWPAALLVILWCGWQLRRGASLARWGVSAFVITWLVGTVVLPHAAWPVVAPTLALPPWPGPAAATQALDMFGPIAAVIAVVGVIVAFIYVPWPALGVTTCLIVLSPVPWRAPWSQSWLWAVAMALATVIGLGWLASRPKRPSLRVVLWLALLFATMVPPLAAWVL